MAKPHSRAFTLVELLVVISIIGMLTAILLPAVNQSIRSARLTQCINNHRQIAQAIIAHTSAKDRFPGYRHVFAGKTDPQSWVVELLPRLGKGDVYDQWGTLAVADHPRLSLLLCPEDQQETLSGPALSYIVNCGLPGEDTRYSGVFYDHSDVVPLADRLKIKLDDFRDGTANTLLLSESYRANRYDDLDDTDATSEMNEHTLGFLWTTSLTSADLVINTAGETNAVVTADDEALINAYHVGGANAAFADGSVKFLSDKINGEVYAKLCTPSGGRCTPPQTGVVSDADLNP